ncbi:hypothetical protein DMUE_6182 [Dictyocoela muelleri]|nr:hypothetical protein DMUE_6182 [Dictyocoela muelleri]
MWKIISESGISDEENLPRDCIDIFNQCKIMHSSYLFIKDLVSFFKARQCDTFNNKTVDSNAIDKSSQVNDIDENNQIVEVTSQSQSLVSTPNTIIVASTLDKVLEKTSIICARNLFDLNDNTIGQVMPWSDT